MNAQKFDNLGEYLAEFLARLRIEQDQDGSATFQVQTTDGLTANDLALLR